MEKNSSTHDSGLNPGFDARTIARSSRASAWRRLALVLVATVISGVIAGCGLVKVGYRNGDMVGMFMMDRYLDLSDEQKDFVKPRLHQLLVWHRTTQLPDYVAFLQGLQRIAPRSITAAEVTAIGIDGRQRATVTIDHALPDLADLALRLRPDNIRAFEKRFADDDAKWRKEFMKGDAQAQQKARYERSLERVEEWYGRFSSEQRDRIRQLSDARPFDNEIVILERARRQRELVALLAKVEHDKPSRETVVAMMKTYVDRFDHNPDPERRAFLDGLRRSTEEMEASIQNLATPQQRARAVAKLQDWVDDFRSLAADAG